MPEEADRWRLLGLRLGFDVVAPVSLELDGESVTFTALLPQFGAKNGMIADPDWNALQPHASTLISCGYGYSAVSLGADEGDQSAQAMLRDWGWSVSERKPPWW